MRSSVASCETVSLSQTHGLLQALAPPPSPIYERCYSIYAAFSLAALGLLCLPLTLSIRSYSSELANGINIFFFGMALLMFLVSLSEHNTNHEDYELAWQRWQDATQCWSSLFYCGQCHHVYHPSTLQSAPLGNLSSLL